MKRMLSRNSICYLLLICLILSAGSVAAEEQPPPVEPGLHIGEGVVIKMPEISSDYEVFSQADHPGIFPGDDPGMMSWTTLLDEDFEGTVASGWDFFGLWGFTDYRSVSGSFSIYPAALAHNPRDTYYLNDVHSWVKYGPMDFSGAAEAYLEFQLWMDIEPINDQLGVCASTDGANFYCYPYSGATSGWEFISIKFSDWPYYAYLGASEVWIKFIFESNATITGPGVFIDDVVVRKTPSAAEPDLMLVSYKPEPNLYNPGDSFNAEIEFANVGTADCPSYSIKEYLSTNTTITVSDIETNITMHLGPTLEPGDFSTSTSTPTIPLSTPPGKYFVGALISCFGDTNGMNDYVAYLNQLDIVTVGIEGEIFRDNFESNDLTSWTRFNPGKTGLSACADGASLGGKGACFYRPPGNDKRRQLIDETPVHQSIFNVYFDFDINSLTFGVGERFRFMQVKMGADRPYFIVLKSQGGQYLMQLNTLLDDLSKEKSAWYVLPDMTQSIGVKWGAATAPGANDGYARLYLEGLLLEELAGLDNDTIYVDTFKFGYTSRMDGKSISGTFFMDELITRNGGDMMSP